MDASRQHHARIKMPVSSHDDCARWAFLVQNNMEKTLGGIAMIDLS